MKKAALDPVGPGAESEGKEESGKSFSVVEGVGWRWIWRKRRRNRRERVFGLHGVDCLLGFEVEAV